MDDVDASVEGRIADVAPIDIDSTKAGQNAAFVEVAQPFQLLAEFVEAPVIRAGLQKFSPLGRCVR